MTVRVRSTDTSIWNDYATCYDQVVARSNIYRSAVSTLIGETAPLEPIPEGSCVMDLGCGTGNVTLALTNQIRNVLIVAVDNNPYMAAVFKRKMKDLLRPEAHGHGVYFMETGIDESLHYVRSEGLSPGYAILNNVLFVLPDPLKTLTLIAGCLHPGGQIRLTGPHKSSDPGALFSAIRSDLEEAGKFDGLAVDFERIYQFNTHELGSFIHRFGLKDVEVLLHRAGFKKILHSTTDYYAGQSMLVCAEI
jgi:SAM-dependent methyltransferase